MNIARYGHGTTTRESIGREVGKDRNDLKTLALATAVNRGSVL